jgi:hypothetical protein
MLDFLHTIQNYDVVSKKIESKVEDKESSVGQKKASLCIVRFSDDLDFPNLLVNNNLPIPRKNKKFMK